VVKLEQRFEGQRFSYVKIPDRPPMCESDGWVGLVSSENGKGPEALVECN